MGQAKQYLEEHQEEIEMNDLLQEFIDNGHLTGIKDLRETKLIGIHPGW